MRTVKDIVLLVKEAQRRYDNELPAAERKVVCKLCGESFWESEMAEKNPNICEGCESFEREEEFRNSLNERCNP